MKSTSRCTFWGPYAAGVGGLASQPPPPPAGPPADYFMSQPASVPPPPGPGFAMPSQPPSYAPAAVGAGVGLGIVSQFTGTALTSCIVGLITIIVPFAFGYAFYILPIAGVLSGLRAIQRGKLIGGATGIGLNLVGGVITIIALHG